MVNLTDTNQVEARDVVKNELLWPLLAPLYVVYFYGPALGGYGFWEGKEWPSICGEITGIQTERYWGAVQEACEDVIWRKFVSFSVGCFIGSIIAYCLLCLTREMVNKVLYRVFPPQTMLLRAVPLKEGQQAIISERDVEEDDTEQPGGLE